MHRPLKISTFMKMALILAEQATCPKRQVACILLDKDYHIIGSGYNGNPSGEAHCSGEDCACVHAEVNAINQCARAYDAAYVVTTCAPCADCFAKIMTYLPNVETIYWHEQSKNSCKMIGCKAEHVPTTVQVYPSPFIRPIRYPARKVGGAYQANGYVVSEFKTIAGNDRVVFEFSEPSSMLHIFNPSQIERMPRCFESQPSVEQQAENCCSDCPVVVECLGVLR